MSIPTALPTRPRPHRQHQPLPRLAITLAWTFAKLSPRRLRTVLGAVRTGARSATYTEAATARDQVVALSLSCAGEGCLQRSLATALLCRMRGSWPTWCTGVRTQPFAAHAWVEAEGRPVGEPQTTAAYRPILSVGPPRP